MILYKPSDRIPVVIGDITVIVSPLTQEQKIRALGARKMVSGVEVVDGSRRAFFAMKAAVKGVIGVKRPDGTDWQPVFDPNGELSDDDAEALFGLDAVLPLVTVCSKLLLGVVAASEVKGADVQLGKVIVAEKKTPIAESSPAT